MPAEPTRLERAVVVMAAATSYFVQDPYATEALEALEAEGWHVIAPEENLARLLRRLDDAEATLRKIAQTDYRGPKPDGTVRAERYFQRNPR